MKTCPVCGTTLEDYAKFCRSCGSAQPDPGEIPVETPVEEPVSAPLEPLDDHAWLYDDEDIAFYKTSCMLVYLLGLPGTVIAQFIGKDSPLVFFHVRQGLKLVITETLLLLAGIFLCWTIIVPIAAVIGLLVLLVVRFICFIRVCKDKVMPAPIVSKLRFLGLIRR